jgi:hypothetical protein
MSQIDEPAQEGEGEEEEEGETDEGNGKFAKIQVDEGDSIVMNMTKLIHHGSMDDVYIL